MANHLIVLISGVLVMKSTMNVVKRMGLAALLLAGMGIFSNLAQAEEFGDGVKTRPVECLLTVNGKTYLSGTCKYDADADGSFRLFGKQYFTYLNVFENGTAEASWNADPKSTHAQAPLGELKRQGACWVNTKVKLCAWDKKVAAPAKNAPTRIKFAKKATSTIVTGKLDNFEQNLNYVIEVGKGQTMTIEQVNAGSKPVTVWLTAPNNEDVNDANLSCNSGKKVSPTVAGDYILDVSECKKADPWKGEFKLKITVK